MGHSGHSLVVNVKIYIVKGVLIIAITKNKQAIYKNYYDNLNLLYLAYFLSKMTSGIFLMWTSTKFILREADTFLNIKKLLGHILDKRKKKLFFPNRI